MPSQTPVADRPERIDAEALAADYDEERPSRRLSPRTNRFVDLWCFGVALFVLRQVFRPLELGSQYYLVYFLALTLPLAFVCYRARMKRKRTADAESGADAKGGADGKGGAAAQPDARKDNPGFVNWVLAALTLVIGLYPVLPLPEFALGGGGFEGFLDRQGSLLPLDVISGLVLLILVLEATRRTTGLVLPAVCLMFLAYMYYGGYLPISWKISHPGIDIDQIVNALYNEASGFFGVPLDVAATYIVLFTIYGAVLDRMGAGRFFVEFSFSLFRKSGSAPGRTVATSGFLLGSVSGSGTATAVTLGSFAWPILKRAGYPKEAAGGMLAASGIGAILSPPTMGAAAFIIAEYLQVSYLQVLGWAIIPTVLYYLGIFLAVEIDARRFGARRVDLDIGSPVRLLLQGGYHFISLGVIVFFLAIDVPPFNAVVYAMGVAAFFGLLEALLGRRPATGAPGESTTGTADDEAADGSATGPQPGRKELLTGFAQRVYAALAAGVRSGIPVIAVCAAAGVITSTIAKTGLGQTLSGALVQMADALAPTEGSVLVLTTVFCAAGILIVGLAVPVTASFILSWVIIGPALITLGAGGPEVAMFIFYYAVLSEVSPPTALAAVASAAITGGRVIPTMAQACKYTLPAFLAPLAFVVSDNGSLLLTRGSFLDVVWATAVCAAAVAALAVVTTGWMFGPTGRIERVLCVPAALLLLYLEPLSMAIGGALLVLAVLIHLGARRRNASSRPDVVEAPAG